LTTLSSTDDELELTDDVDDDQPAAAPRRRRRRRIITLVVIAFVATRLFAGYVADHPDFYGPNMPDASGDVGRYDSVSWDMRHADASPYGPILRVEYPPGAIPVIMVPRYVRVVSYRTEYIAMMIALDALGLVALARIARRTGSWWGFATWFLLVPALGPVSYTRLDLVAAVALVWMMERALEGQWEFAGLLIGVAASVKLIPAVLFPLLFFAVSRERRVRYTAGFGVVVAACVLPFVNVLPDLYTSTITYHTERGVQAESIWGAGLLTAHWVADYPVAIVASHRAWDASAPAAATLKTLSNVVTAAVVLVALGLAAARRRLDLGAAVLLALALTALIVGVERVYSPQYLLWIIALGAGAMALTPRRAAPAVGVLAVTTLLAHLEFPIWFWDLLFYDKGGALIVLVVRDVLTIVVGLLALWAWRRHPAPAPPPTLVR
jgi:hypothetical protein